MSTIEIMKKTTLDYSSLGASQSQILMLAPAISVDRGEKAQLQVRGHDAPDIDGDSRITVAAYRASPSAEDPGITFVAGEEPLALITIDADTTGLSGSVGQLLTANFPDNFGSHVAIVLEAVQDSGAGNINANISVSLVVKP